MPKPYKFSYKKKEQFRDAFYFIVVYEGDQREPEYFRFFDGLSSRVKIVPVKSNHGSAPKILVQNAINKIEELDTTSNTDAVWLVIDTDKWREQLHEIRQECEHHSNWHVAQSNPCFEVWLYFHARSNLPEFGNILQCKSWKSILPQVIMGGFNSDIHPVHIETAIFNAKASYKANGYFPEAGSTQLWQLGEQLLLLIKKDLDVLKQKFPYL